MKIKKDRPGHIYIDVNGVRLTYIPAKDRPAPKDWAGQDVLAIRAYRDGRQLHRGAEIPIGGGEGVADVMVALFLLLSAR
jgi:hypothetical protein